jgi:hypothetical protein
MGKFILIDNEIINSEHVISAEEEDRGDTLRVVLTFSNGHRKLILGFTLEQVLSILNGEPA